MQKLCVCICIYIKYNLSLRKNMPFNKSLTFLCKPYFSDHEAEVNWLIFLRYLCIYYTIFTYPRNVFFKEHNFKFIFILQSTLISKSARAKILKSQSFSILNSWGIFSSFSEALWEYLCKELS